MQFVDQNGTVVPPARTAVFDFDLDSTVVYAQFTTIHTYNQNQYSNGNVTAGYRWTLNPLQETSASAVKYYLPRCPAYSSRTQGNSPCICLTLDCYLGDTATADAFVPFPAWTFTTPIQFVTTVVFPASLGPSGITPDTNEHSPRLSIMPIVAVPYLRAAGEATPLTPPPAGLPVVPESVGIALAAVDEDGTTTVSYAADSPAVFAVSADGTMTVPALSRRTSSGAPYKIITSSTGDTDFYNLALFLARGRAIDPVTAVGKPSVAATEQFWVRSCRNGGAVPVAYFGGGVEVAPDVQYLFSGPATAATAYLPHTTPIFASVGPGRCQVGPGSVAPLLTAAGNQSACLAAGGIWRALWLTAPVASVGCVVDQVFCRLPAVCARLCARGALARAWFAQAARSRRLWETGGKTLTRPPPRATALQSSGQRGEAQLHHRPAPLPMELCESRQRHQRHQRHGWRRRGGGRRSR